MGMGTQLSTKCLTSNCTKKTTHASGICHLHRKRRVNTNGDIEYCFPSICYFKSDVTIKHLDVRGQPKRRRKQKTLPAKIKSFADLEVLLAHDPEPGQVNGLSENPPIREQRPCEKKLNGHRTARPVPGKHHTGKSKPGFGAPCQTDSRDREEPENRTAKTGLWGRVSGFFRRGR